MRGNVGASYPKRSFPAGSSDSSLTAIDWWMAASPPELEASRSEFFNIILGYFGVDKKLGL